MYWGWPGLAVLPLLLCVAFYSLQATASNAFLPLLKRDQGYDAPGSHPVHDAESDLEHFVTRRDIVAPRWDVRVYDEHALAPGHWFVAPYQDARQARRGGNWVGPHIYDASTGELIWSGVPLFHGWTVFDFRAYSSHGSPNEDMLSLILRHEAGILLDNTYQIRKKSYISGGGRELNLHEFHTVDNSTRLLQMTLKETLTTPAISADIGYDGRCNVNFQGFEERDIETLATTFQWLSEGIIPLNETFLDVAPAKQRCESSPYDYIHCNSLDKFPDGDFLLACRHSDTVYKISKDDGSIIWRLGGSEQAKSDFLLDGHFGGQHGVKIWHANDTHITIGMVDNALRIGSNKVSNDISRGLLISLNTQEMKASVVSSYDHPQAELVVRGGNLQILPNGNAFIGFSDYSSIAEYTNNGTLLMEAKVRPNTKSYRAFKFPWNGYPTLPPDVYSVTFAKDKTYRTNIYISWNGATEVDTWEVYQANADGSAKLTTSTPKMGFETSITLDEYVSHVVVAALDRNGNELGRSKVTKTVGPAGVIAGLDAEEVQWIQSHPPLVVTIFQNPTVAFLAGIVLCAAMAVIGLAARGFTRGVSPSKRTLDSECHHLLTRVGSEEDFELEEEQENEGDPGGYLNQKERKWD